MEPLTLPFKLSAQALLNSQFARFDQFKEQYSSRSDLITVYGAYFTNSIFISIVELTFGIALYFGPPPIISILLLVAGSLSTVASLIRRLYKRYKRDQVDETVGQSHSAMSLPQYTSNRHETEETNRTGTTAESRRMQAISSQHDLERGPKTRSFGPARKRYTNDYTGLASLMVENPEKAILRRFTLLNIKNLLYMQAEITLLEKELEDAVAYDKQFKDTQDYAGSWFLLQNWYEIDREQNVEIEPSEGELMSSTSPTSPLNTDWQFSETATAKPTTRSVLTPPTSTVFTPLTSTDRDIGLASMERTSGNMENQAQSDYHYGSKNDRPKLQRDLVNEIRGKLDKYNTALQQVAFNLGLSSPKKMDVKGLQDWLQGEAFGKQFLLGIEQQPWQAKNERDLVGVALPPGESDDAFATSISKRMIVLFNYLTGIFTYLSGKLKPTANTKPVLLQWNDSWLLFIVSLAFTTLAACFPVLAILALYKTEANGVSKGWQIGMIGFFSATCAAVLALAKAKRTDVFLATSAFAAVMVVFIKA